MTRPIKFKVWDKIKKAWFTPIYEAFRGNLYDLSITLSGKIIVRTLKDCASLQEWQTGQFEIVEFTGLLDKNGKEIYEGDIIRCFDTAGEVVYDQPVELPDFYQEIWSNNEHGMPCENGDKTKVEIIGNIYEHPELLADKENIK